MRQRKISGRNLHQYAFLYKFISNLLSSIHETITFCVFPSLQNFSKEKLAEAILNRNCVDGWTKGSWAVSHLEISRPISFESGARLLTAVARVSFSLYRRTWTVSTVFHGIECSLIKPELDISRSSSDVNRQTRHVLLSTRQTSSFKSV